MFVNHKLELGLRAEDKSLANLAVRRAERHNRRATCKGHGIATLSLSIQARGIAFQINEQERIAKFLLFAFQCEWMQL